MDRSREARRVTMAASNGLPRRRHRTNSLRDSPEEDGPLELQETARLRDRGGSGKKDRDRERDRERDRDRLSRSKRRRGERLMHGNREDGGEDSSEESVNDEEEDDDDDGGGGASVRMLPPNPLPSSSMSNHHNHHHHQHHRKSFPPPAKVFKAATTATWKAADEMIGVSVPRKARSASTKRSHECWVSGAIVGEVQIHRQTSTSPVRPPVAAAAATMLASPAPASPSSSNASVRKKTKPNGPKQRPPKSSSKSSSSAQDEIEIEIAEVLYGMMRQPQGPSKQEASGNDSMKFDHREANKSTTDAKSRVSSPISNSPSAPLQSSIFPTHSSSSATPMSAIAPKRKRPRPVKYDDENPSTFAVRSSPISSTTKAEVDQPAKPGIGSPNLERNSGSAAENGVNSYDLTSSQAPTAMSSEPPQVLAKPESYQLSDSKALTEESESKDVGSAKEEPQSPKKDSPPPGLRLDDGSVDLTATKVNFSSVSEMENQREEKFQIDLMAPPPSRSSPERDGESGFVGTDSKHVVTDVETESKGVVKEDQKTVKIGSKEDVIVEPEEKKVKVTAEETESKKPIVPKERNIDLHLDLEKSERDIVTNCLTNNKQLQNGQKQQQQPNTEKTGQPGSLPLPMSMASWPGGLPPMGYMAPLQGVVSMDGTTISPAAVQPPHMLFNQARPKRCATHCYIARNIHYHQQFTRMNPFWPAAAGSASIYGAKACNLNVVPPTDLHANVPGRCVNSAQDKSQTLAIFPGNSGKDKNSQPANVVDAAQRKQILLQQALPPGAPNNILHGPAFIFPLSQQQAAAAASASVRPGTMKSSPAVGSSATSSTSNTGPVSSTTTVTAPATAMSFNYPNMPGNETQYLAILQNNAYPFPIPAHVGAPPAYRGNHAQAMPFFNGSFYSSQMLHHPSQLQQQQPPAQSQQNHQVHQNTSVSSGSSASQKHLQNQQQRPHGTAIGGSGGAGVGVGLQGFPAQKNQPSQSVPVQQRPHQNQHVTHQARQLESEMGGEDSPSTADSRVSRANMNMYGQNFAMPIHSPNFALLTPVSIGSTTGATSTSGNNHSDKKQQQQQTQQQQSSKPGVETLASQAFAMSFASLNGGASTAPGLDISSIAHNHALFQSLPEAARHSYQIMAAAQAAQQKKIYRVSDEGKTGGNDATNVEEERKAMSGKSAASVGQSIAFSRQDLTDSAVSTMPGNTVIDSSARSLNLSSASARAGSGMPASISSSVNASTGQHQQQQQKFQQQQQMIHLQKQQQFAAARSKMPATSNGSVYSDHLPSSSMAAKFPNALSAFPQNLVQGNSSPAQSTQWKNSARAATSQVASASLASSAMSLKNLPQQQVRTQQNHTQISFAANTKSSGAPQGQPLPSSNQSPSPSMGVSSPTTSSMSKSAGGSPRTTASTSTANKGGQASTLSSQQPKNSQAMPARKSSPVGGRNVPSILGSAHITSSSTVTKPQLSQQQQLPKHALQQAQLFFSSPYMQAQAQHSASTASNATAAGGYYLQRHRSDQQQQPQGSVVTTSSGMLSLCSPVTLASTTTTDPAKAVAAAAAAAAAASNMKGGGLSSQGLIHTGQFGAAQSSGKAHQLVPPGFPYVHTVPPAVQVKPAEQKQPAGE